MKVRLSEFRRIIREALLMESTCPLCGSEGAYVGLNDVECPNPGCEAYSRKQATDILPRPRRDDIVMKIYPGEGWPMSIDDEEYEMTSMADELMRDSGMSDDEIESAWDYSEQNASGPAWEALGDVIRDLAKKHGVTHVNDEGWRIKEPEPIDKWLESMSL